MDRKAYTGKIINIGGTLYVGVPPELRDQVSPGDIMEYEPTAVAPKGQISQTRPIRVDGKVAVQRAATRNSAVAGAKKVSGAGTDHGTWQSALLGLEMRPSVY